MDCIKKPRYYVSRAEILTMYLNGRSIKSLVNMVHASQLFVSKEKARGYVECVIHDYLISQ